MNIQMNSDLLEQPIEILRLILSFVTPLPLSRNILRLVCRRFRNAVDSDHEWFTAYKKTITKPDSAVFFKMAMLANDYTDFINSAPIAMKPNHLVTLKYILRYFTPIEIIESYMFHVFIITNNNDLLLEVMKYCKSVTISNENSISILIAIIIKFDRIELLNVFKFEGEKVSAKMGYLILSTAALNNSARCLNSMKSHIQAESIRMNNFHALSMCVYSADNHRVLKIILDEWRSLITVDVLVAGNRNILEHCIRKNFTDCAEVLLNYIDSNGAMITTGQIVDVRMIIPPLAGMSVVLNEAIDRRRRI